MSKKHLPIPEDSDSDSSKKEKMKSGKSKSQLSARDKDKKKKKKKSKKGKKKRKKMDESEIEAQFSRLITSKGLEDRKEFTGMSIKEKKRWLDRNEEVVPEKPSRRKAGSSSVAIRSKGSRKPEAGALFAMSVAEVLGPRDHAKKLARNAALTDLKRFERDMSEKKSREWTGEFIRAGGVASLARLLADTEKVRGKTRDQVTISQRCVELITQLMRESRSTLNALVDSSTALKDICLGSDSNISEVKSGVNQILAVICSARPEDGQPKVIEALTYYAYKNKQMRFEHLVLTLQHDTDFTVLSSTMTLLNAIINVISDINERIAIRNELYALGIEDVLLNFRAGADELDENTVRQVEAFFSDVEQDEEEFTEFVADLNEKYSHLDENDPEGIFSALLDRVSEHDYLKKPLLNIMKELLVFPTDKSRGFRQWLVVDKLVHQMKSNADEFRVDPTNTINLEELYVDISNTAKYESEIQEIYTQNSKLKQKYRSLREKYENNEAQVGDIEGLLEKEKKILKEKMREQLNEKIEDATYMQLSEIKELKNALAAKEEDIEKRDAAMREGFKKFQDDVKKKNKIIKELNAEIDEFDDELDEILAEQKKKFNLEKKNMATAMGLMKKDLDSKATELAQLKAEQEEIASQRIQEMQKELREQYRENIKAEKARGEERIREVELNAQAKYERLLETQSVDMNRDQNREIKRYEDIIQQLQKEKMEKDETIATLNTNIQLISDEFESARHENQKKHRIFEDGMKQMENQLNERRNEIQDLQEKLDQKEEKTKFRSDNIKKEHKIEIDKLNAQHEEALEVLRSQIARLDNSLNQIDRDSGSVQPGLADELTFVRDAAAQERKKLTNTIIQLERDLDQADANAKELVEEKTRLLEVELLKKDRKIDELQRTKEDLEDSLHHQTSEFDKQKREMGSELVSLRASFTEVSLKFDKSQAKIDSLQSQLENVASTGGNTGQYNSSLRNQLNDANDEITKLVDKIKFLESKSSVTHYASLETEISELSAENINLSAEKEALEDAIQDIKNGRDASKEKLKKLSSTIQELEEELDSLRGAKISKQELENELNVALSKNNELKTIMKGRTIEEFDSLKEKLAELTERIGDSDLEAFEDLKDNLTKILNEQEVLTQQLSSHLTEHDDLISKFEKLSKMSAEESQSLEDRLSESKKEVRSLIEEIDVLKDQVEELSGNGTKINIEQKKNDKLKEMLSKSQAKVNELITQISDLEEENEDLRDAQEELEEQIENLATGGDTHEARKAISEFKQENEKLIQEIEELEKKIISLQEEKSNLEKEVTELSKFATLHHQLEKEVSDLKKQMKTMSTNPSPQVTSSTTPEEQPASNSEAKPADKPAEFVAAAIVAPPPPPGMGGIPPPPGMGGIPPPPGMMIPPPPGMMIPPPPGGIPPPPGMMGGIPPPPGMMGGIPPPPGMGGMGAAAQVWRGPKPKVKVKQFNWSKIPTRKVQQTVFKTLDPNTVELDFSSLEDLFCVKQAKKENEEEKEKKKLPPKEKKHSCLDGKTQQNVGIFLKNLKKDPEDVVDAIYTLDEDVLNEEIMHRLIENLPPAEDVANINAWLENPENSVDKLEDPDKYFLTLSSIEQLEIRMSTFLFVVTFDTKIAELEDPLMTYISVIEDFNMHAEKFNKLIEIVLAVGNFLNSGTSRGNCSGFSLRSLTKLRDTKSIDNKRTLIDYIVEFIEKENPALLELVKDLAGTKAASRYSFQGVKDDMSEIKRGLELSEAQIPTVAKSKSYKYDVYYQKMPVEITECRAQYEDYLLKVEQAEDDFKKILKDYGEDEKTKPAEFFSLIKDFLGFIEEAIGNNEKLRIAREKEAKKEELERQKALKKKEMEDRKANKGLGDSDEPREGDPKIRGTPRGRPVRRRVRKRGGRDRPGPTREEEEHVDDLFDNLVSGNAFESRTLMRKDTLSAKKKQKERNRM